VSSFGGRKQALDLGRPPLTAWRSACPFLEPPRLYYAAAGDSRFTLRDDRGMFAPCPASNSSPSAIVTE